MAAERRVDSDATTQEWCGGLRGKCIGDGKGESRISDQIFSIAARAPHAGGDVTVACRLFAALAPLASHTRGTLPPHADTISLFEVLHQASFSSHRSHDFMARNERIGTYLPVVIDKVDVAVANAATLHSDLYVKRS
jgi:hypothetical protein